MIAAKLIQLIETHAGALATDVARDLATNPLTPGFRSVPVNELVERVSQVVRHLGDWIGAPGSDAMRTEFSDWGRRRFGQGIPLSQIVAAAIIIKTHLRRYIRENGLVDAAFPRVEADYILPMHLHSLQELNDQVSTFFDEALFDLAQGYERASTSS